MPRSQRPGGPSILIGGNGARRTLPLVARYANVWNVMHLTPELFRERSQMLDDLLRREGRQPGDVKRTMMALVFCGRDEAELRRRAAFIHRNWAPELEGQTFDQLMASLDEMLFPFLGRLGARFVPIVGTPEQEIERMRAYEAAGVEELIIQWFDVEDIEGLRMYAEYILPKMQS
jgi:alkanesulfonate monooxygenase SsuD/methylene tetrahydromethanopterin reductase-like flavin-dependent oxidoreductase (luciferase family)